MKAQDGRPLAHFFSFCFLPENAFDPSCSCIFDRIKTHFSVHIFICGVNRSGVEARVLASNPWAWVLFSVLMSRRVDLVWRWFSFLSKSFLLGSLVYLCKRTNTPLLLPRTAQREGEGGGGLRTLTFFEEKLVLLSMLPSPCLVDWSLCVRH